MFSKQKNDVTETSNISIPTLVILTAISFSHEQHCFLNSVSLVICSGNKQSLFHAKSAEERREEKKKATSKHTQILSYIINHYNI